MAGGGGRRDAAQTFVQREGLSRSTRMVWKPEMPFAPVTMAVRFVMAGEKVGREVKMPLFWSGREAEPILNALVVGTL